MNKLKKLLNKNSIIFIAVILVSIIAFIGAQKLQKNISASSQKSKNKAAQASIKSKDKSAEKSDAKKDSDTKENSSTNSNSSSNNSSGTSSNSDGKSSDKSNAQGSKQDSQSSSKNQGTNTAGNQSGSGSTQNNTVQPNVIFKDCVSNKTIPSAHMNLSGMSVAKVTSTVLDNNHISYNEVDSLTGAYFSEIAGLKERGAGLSSGWCFYVNGVKSSQGASNVNLNDGDVLEWRYLADGLH